MKDIIKLQSHNKTNNFLRVVQGKEYKLVTPFHTVRVTYRTDKKGILSIDPSGGPMIVIGYELEEAEAVVKSINFVEGYGWAITFE